MKIRILKPFETTKGRLIKGNVIDITPAVAQRWITQGDAEPIREPVKKLSPENKVITPPENKPTRRQARRARK
ncbi:hypothetical protein B1778_04305 [Dehalococcoides mccartyi]|uniref:hypothetical protein n=1 Tax=Dehalococcoides mccartyi TaxID=61435 RepID=UPI0002B75E66|nr:hypothetical protein [Dehalococcoides mccartyi]AGG07974.1 hypothetical protein btf_887 [Dehalococcoides mccartyi BTF08]AQU05957.1 hypothetical protein B1777_04490 [Dehalococcoides mccartyi]AQU07402.1 hypothetical protein B1778_04305 [Dehalococcoides mccartyi]AQW62505.1 hypothetical protein B1779_04310 [Dehalococcoides mccartyi]